MQRGEAKRDGSEVEEQSVKATPDTNPLSVMAEKSMWCESEMQEN